MSDTNHTPAEAGALLALADRLSRSAHNAMRWRYIAFLLGLGVATSLGSFAMGQSTGRAFGIAYVGTLSVGFALVMFFAISIHGHAAFARSRRWTIYIVCWLVPYVAAIAVVVWAHDSLVWSAITSGLILVSTATCAAWEARS
jgi:hypothetical protein